MKAKTIYSSNQIKILQPDFNTELKLPVTDAGIRAGFPSPAGDYLEETLDLNKKLIKNPSSTFFARVIGSSMEGDGISDGDILVVDKSLDPRKNSILVCFIDGEFTIKRLEINENGRFLMPSNSEFNPIKIESENDFRLWGVVTYSIKYHY